MKLRDILRVKGSDVFSTSPTTKLPAVIDKLVQCNCGSLVVKEDDRTIGIITERDILRACSERHNSLAEVQVREYMSAELLTGKPDDAVENVMGVMTKNRVRHMPVMEQGKLIGIISIGDVVKAQHDLLSVENHYLKNYIQS